eukprot:TRINITY_DN21433_c0_g1_i1.p1 TRINITY_DN21433_c0_g1~~TRINITY_DN21433_c0_g1_i1.p1  ORF type:complete len:170 (+),score=39.93 TRINITY_DN21433_c0_g1_i1:337-846(+)
MYTSKDQLQLYCIFMIAIAGIEAVFLAVKLRRDAEDIVQMVLICSLFLTVCIGYQATESRSRTRAKWFCQGLVVVEVLELAELCVSVVRRWGISSNDTSGKVDHLITSEIFNIVSSALGLFLGYRYYVFLDSGAVLATGAYLSPQVVQIQGDDVDNGPPDAKQTLFTQL